MSTSIADLIAGPLPKDSPEQNPAPTASAEDAANAADAADAAGAAGADEECRKLTKTDAYKLISLIFVLVLGSDTDLFTSGVLGAFRGTIRPDGYPNIKGTMLKALIVMLLFALIMYLVVSDVV